MKVFLTMYEGNTKIVECKKLIIEDGSKIKIDDEECQMLAVITADEIFHPVVSVEVL